VTSRHGLLSPNDRQKPKSILAESEPANLTFMSEIDSQ
jgi:hypothetical protein